MRTDRLAVLVALLALSSAVASAATNCKIEESVVNLRVSGVDGSTDAVLDTDSNRHALKKIQNHERNDEPCRTRAIFGRLAGSTSSSAQMTEYTDNCPSGSLGDEIEVGVTDEDVDGIFIGAVRVCTNNKLDTNKRRLKGLQIRLRKVTDTCETEPFDPDDPESYEVDTGSHDYGVTVLSGFKMSETRAHCSDWYDWRSCPPNMVATGFAVKSGSRGVQGIKLKCREVVPR